MRAKYKQPYVTQSEVFKRWHVLTFTLLPHLEPNLIIAIEPLTLSSKGRAPEVSRLYGIPLKWQLRARVST